MESNQLYDFVVNKKTIPKWSVALNKMSGIRLEMTVDLKEYDFSKGRKFKCSICGFNEDDNQGRMWDKSKDVNICSDCVENLKDIYDKYPEDLIDIFDKAEEDNIQEMREDMIHALMQGQATMADVMSKVIEVLDCRIQELKRRTDNNPQELAKLQGHISKLLNAIQKYSQNLDILVGDWKIYQEALIDFVDEEAISYNAVDAQ